MSYGSVVSNADAQVRKEIAERETAALVAQKIALLDGYGEDNFADRTVIRYGKQFDKGSKTYTYAAVKIGENWTDTGGTPRTWSQLVSFLIEGPVPTASIEVLAVAESHPASTPTADVKADPKN